MAVIVMNVLPGITPEQQSQLNIRVNPMSVPPEGLLVHTTHFGTVGSYNIDAWTSEDAFRTFVADRLFPAVHAAGIDVEPEVSIFPAHEVFVVESIVAFDSGQLTIVCCDIPETTPEQYDEVSRQVDWHGNPEPGGLAHMCWFSGGTCFNLDAWESSSAFEAFVAGRLAASMAVVGANAPEVNYYPSHTVFAAQPVLVVDG